MFLSYITQAFTIARSNDPYPSAYLNDILTINFFEIQRASEWWSDECKIEPHAKLWDDKNVRGATFPSGPHKTGLHMQLVVGERCLLNLEVTTKPQLGL